MAWTKSPPGWHNPWMIAWPSVSPFTTPWPWLEDDGTLAAVEDAGEHWTPEPVTAYKHITLNKGDLTSIDLRYTGTNIAWPTEWLHAQCLCYQYQHQGWSVALSPNLRPGVNHENVPALKGSCGFYAYKYRPGKSMRLATFKVQLAGRIIEHESGYRAKLMRVIELVDLPEVLFPSVRE